MSPGLSTIKSTLKQLERLAQKFDKSCDQILRFQFVSTEVGINLKECPAVPSMHDLDKDRDEDLHQGHGGYGRSPQQREYHWFIIGSRPHILDWQTLATSAVKCLMLIPKDQRGNCLSAEERLNPDGDWDNLANPHPDAMIDCIMSWAESDDGKNTGLFRRSTWEATRCKSPERKADLQSHWYMILHHLNQISALAIRYWVSKIRTEAGLSGEGVGSGRRPSHHGDPSAGSEPTPEMVQEPEKTNIVDSPSPVVDDRPSLRRFVRFITNASEYLERYLDRDYDAMIRLLKSGNSSDDANRADLFISKHQCDGGQRSSKRPKVWTRRDKKWLEATNPNSSCSPDDLPKRRAARYLDRLQLPNVLNSARPHVVAFREAMDEARGDSAANELYTLLREARNAFECVLSIARQVDRCKGDGRAFGQARARLNSASSALMRWDRAPVIGHLEGLGVEDSVRREDDHNSSAEGKAQPKKRRRGRPKADETTRSKEAKLARRWREASAMGTSRKEFARENGLELWELKELLDRVRKRSDADSE